MKEKDTFLKNVCHLAIPVALQSMLQASFGMVDQMMIGQLGSVNVAGVGLAGKFSSIYTVIVSAIGAAAGIMISQYMGQNKTREVRRSFFINLLFACGLSLLFALPCLLCPENIMRLYVKEESTVAAAAGYLVITAASFLPAAAATLFSTLLRCMEKAVLPLAASIVAAVANTGLNYLLIFGKGGFAPMGVAGAAVATVISQILNAGIMLVFLGKYRKVFALPESEAEPKAVFEWNQYVSILLPILICEFMWSLGENVYAAIYGHLGTKSCAAMTLTNPIQGLTIGALCGLSQAAGILIGKLLGKEKYDEAYWASKRLMLYGFIGSVVLSLLILFAGKYYVEIYQVEESVKLLTQKILAVYALIAPFKVLNMIVGGGILRSGGNTKLVMMIDLIGTWVFGVPLGLLAAFVLELSIPSVYFLLSLEEIIRFLISLVVFRRKRWMKKLQ